MSLPLLVSDTASVAQNYFDCTESNDEDDDEEEEKEGKGDVRKGEGGKDAPKWEDFFATEPLSDSQNSQSHSCCSRETGSQTPDLFSDGDRTLDDPEAFSLTLSTSVSNHSSQNLDDTLILHPWNATVDGVQSEPEELTASQASSDFDIPPTPESKAPQPNILLELYKKLAAGEEVVIGGGQTVHEGDQHRVG